MADHLSKKNTPRQQNFGALYSYENKTPLCNKMVNILPFFRDVRPMGSLKRINPQEIGRVMEKLRKERGITQVELANLLNVSQSVISKMEAGKSVPDVIQWMEFCDHMNISPNQFFSPQTSDETEESKSKS